MTKEMSTALPVKLKRPRVATTIKTAKIPLQWLSLTRPLTKYELLALANEVNRQGISPDSLNQVREVWGHLQVPVPVIPNKRIHLPQHG